MKRSDNTPSDRGSTTSTIVICHAGKTKKALYEILGRMNCEVCEITSLGDLLTFLKDSDYSSLHFSDNHHNGPREPYTAPGGAGQIFDGTQDVPSSTLQSKTTESDFFARSTDNMTLREIEAIHIRNTLTRCGWKCKLAARELGIDRTTLYRKMKKFGIFRKEPKTPGR